MATAATCLPRSTLHRFTYCTAIHAHSLFPPPSSPLSPASYYMSLGILCGLILAAIPWAATGLSNQLGRARKENVTIRKLFE